MQGYFSYLKLHRDKFLAIVFTVLPIVAYLAGSGTYEFHAVGNENMIAALSIAPRFDAMYRWYVGNYGIEGAQGFLVLAFYFILLFAVQIALIGCLALYDVRQSTPIKFSNASTSMAAMILVGGVFVLFFFFPSIPKNTVTRMYRLFMFTDVKFFVIAALYWFFISFFHIAIVQLGQMLMPGKSLNRN
jgi:hypothetical protein